jgi:hypothetical protein
VKRETLLTILVVAVLAAAAAYLLHLKGYDTTDEMMAFFVFIVALIVLTVVGNVIADAIGVTERARKAIVLGIVIAGSALFAGAALLFA